MRLVVLNSQPAAQLAATQKVLKAGDVLAAGRYRDILDAAGDTAQRILHEAEREVERTREEASEQVRLEREQRRAATLVETAAMRMEAARRLEDDVAGLVMEALAVVLKGQPREQLIGLALDAIRASLVRAKWINVVVHPDSVAAAAQATREFAERTGIACPIAVVPNPSMEADACILESNFGSADASVRTQLANLESALTDAARALVRGRGENFSETA